MQLKICCAMCIRFPWRQNVTLVSVSSHCAVASSQSNIATANEVFTCVKARQNINQIMGWYHAWKEVYLKNDCWQQTAGYKDLSLQKARTACMWWTWLGRTHASKLTAQIKNLIHTHAHIWTHWHIDIYAHNDMHTYIHTYMYGLHRYSNP